MTNSQQCEHCGTPIRDLARYCSRCGRPVTKNDPPAHNAAANGWRTCDNAADLKFRWGSAWGGSPLLGTENLAVTLVNYGHGLRELTVEIRGLNRNRDQVFAVRQEIEQLDSGQQATFELPSYEIPEETRDVTLSLISATRT